MCAVTSTQPTGNGRHSRVDAPPPVPAIPLSPEPSVQRQDQSVGDLVREASTHLSTLIRSEMELARAELTGEMRKGVKGSVYSMIALAILLFSLFFLFFTMAEVIALWLQRWAAFAIVVAVMLLVAGVFGLLGYLRVRSIRKPERTISSLQQTVQLTKREPQREDGTAAHSRR
jgi:uncharacterized membrane protein YqjE